jgi:lysozyme
MNLDQSGFDFLVQEEGLELTAYQDIRKIWTIGIGQTYYADGSPVKEGDTLTEQGAYDLFDATSKEFQSKVSNTNPNLTQNQFSALFSLCWNIGISGYENSTVHRLVSANPEDPNIEQAFYMWKRAGNNPTALLGRREREYQLYIS